jgi:hypothetical protein
MFNNNSRFEEIENNIHGLAYQGRLGIRFKIEIFNHAKLQKYDFLRESYEDEINKRKENSNQTLLLKNNVFSPPWLFGSYKGFSILNNCCFNENEGHFQRTLDSVFPLLGKEKDYRRYELEEYLNKKDINIVDFEARNGFFEINSSSINLYVKSGVLEVLFHDGHDHGKGIKITEFPLTTLLFGSGDLLDIESEEKFTRKEFSEGTKSTKLLTENNFERVSTGDGGPGSPRFSVSEYENEYMSIILDSN